MSQPLVMKTAIASVLADIKPFSSLPPQELERLAPFCFTRFVPAEGLMEIVRPDKLKESLNPGRDSR